MAQATTTHVQAELPSLNRQYQLVQNIFYETDSSREESFSVQCFLMKAANDSLLIYAGKSTVTVRKGVQVYPCVIRHQQDSGYVQQDAYSILRKTGALPAGSYRIYLTISGGDSTNTYDFHYTADSQLAVQSPVSKDLQRALSPERSLRIAGVQFSTAKASPRIRNGAQALDRSARRIERSLQSQGLSGIQRAGQGGRYIDIYYKDWFVGYYKADSAASPEGALDEQRRKLGNDVGAFATTGMGDIRSIFTQVKELNKQRKSEQEGSGEIGLTAYAGNGQEENSAQDNNYYELRGQLEMPVMDIPVSVQGFYTSQDRSRKVKASYIRVHYDTEKAKEQLMKMIGSYTGKYEQAAARGKGLDMVYQSYLSKLSNERTTLLADLGKETGISKPGLDTAAFRKQLKDSLAQQLPDTSAADSSRGSKALRKGRQLTDSATAAYDKAMTQYRRVQQLQQDIDKYQRLLDQYRNTTYFDSAMAYDQLKDLQHADDMSYKQLSKKAAALLPEGNVKKFATGLTHVDAGIFNKQESAYTLSGQTVKGIDAGYDFGLFQTAFTLGRVEYAGRDGSLDRYTGYSGRVLFKPAKQQKASIIYYGYTPSSKMLSDDPFFRDVTAALPSFRSPVHIVSVTYSGSIRQHLRFEAEAASSFRQADKSRPNGSLNEKMAYTLKADGDIPRTNMTVDAGYEHVGRNFENNSAPVNVSGLERYTIGAKGLFFRNFLTLGVQYNYLEQRSFSGTGGNNKWGFEVKTSSKRYPSVSVSYKPFATFRLPNDTLHMPQRPLLGAVWTGKASYQLKKKDYTLRFTAVYSDNRSTMDTVNSHNSVLQLNTIYQDKQLMGMVNIGRTVSDRDDSGSLHRSASFIQLSGGLRYDAQWTLNAGADLGAAAFGMSKLGGTLGCNYQFKTLPVSIRAGARYSCYRLSEAQIWRQLVSGTIDVLWRFRFKMRQSE